MELRINRSSSKEEPEEEPEVEEETSLERYAKAREILKKNNNLVMEYFEDDDEDDPISFWITPSYSVIKLTTDSLRTVVNYIED